jgi:hypothetical protein
MFHTETLQVLRVSDAEIAVLNVGRIGEFG